MQPQRVVFCTSLDCCDKTASHVNLPNSLPLQSSLHIGLFQDRSHTEWNTPYQIHSSLNTNLWLFCRLMRVPVPVCPCVCLVCLYGTLSAQRSAHAYNLLLGFRKRWLNDFCVSNLVTHFR